MYQMTTRPPLTQPPPSQPIKRVRKYVGPSQMATILGLNPYQTREQLMDEFLNGYTNQEKISTQFGNDHESTAIYYYQKLTQVATTKPSFIVDPHNPKIGGIADALIDDQTGLEIKCHVAERNLLTGSLPLTYLIQVAGYMYLYQRSKWVLMSCIFHPDHTLDKYTLHEVTWEQVRDRWTLDWYPKITQFTQEIISRSSV